MARKQLGWSPSVGLDDGLDKTIKWVRNNLDRYRIGIYEL
jgi:dTDP-glucose 4,6-dehydratase